MNEPSWLPSSPPPPSRSRPLAISALNGGLIGGSAGFLLTAVSLFTLIFVVQVNGLRLQTGVRFIDSMLYSLNGPFGAIAIIVIWSMVSAIIGAIVIGTAFVAVRLVRQ